MQEQDLQQYAVAVRGLEGMDDTCNVRFATNEREGGTACGHDPCACVLQRRRSSLSLACLPTCKLKLLVTIQPISWTVLLRTAGVGASSWTITLSIEDCRLTAVLA